MTEEKKKPIMPKMTISQALHRTLRLPILLDIVIDEEIVEGFEAGWVRIVGGQDPEYLLKVHPIYMKYRQDLDDSEQIEDTEEKREFLENATVELHTSTVTLAIKEWDEDFFEGRFTPEYALELFKQERFNIIYNQIAKAMQKREDFLPIVSIEQKSG